MSGTEGLDMLKVQHCLAIFVLVVVGISTLACTAAMDEKVRESTRVPGLQEGVQARDRAIQSVVQTNIESDLELRWFAQTYGITVEVSHTVATVHMKVRTEEQRDRALELAKTTKDVSDVVDNIVVDPSLDEAPFEL